jgi:hypothetical protein
MSSGDEHFMESVTGDINGVNRDFSTLYDFVSDTLYVIEDGILIKQSDTALGITVTGSNSFRTHEAPVTGRDIKVRYIEA